MSSSSFLTPQKLLLLFLTIFAVQSVMLLFLILRPIPVGAQARAGGDNPQNPQECPCGFLKTSTAQTATKIDTSRLYIPIPGVTDACGFVCDVNGDARGDVVDYIFTVYKLLIGIAAVVAFAMIVYAGYEWIFAMGNSGKITDAKERIMSACIGLGLALVSVQFLQTLSPQLTNLYLPDVTKIARASVNPFCRETDIVLGFNTADPKHRVAVALPSARPEDKTQITCQSQFIVAVRIEGDKAHCYSKNKDQCWKEIKAKFDNPPQITGEDGKPITITYENIVTYDAKSAPKCQGTYCDGGSENVCYPSDPYARSFSCKSADKACNDTDDKRNGCEEVNKWLKFQGYIGRQCAKRVDVASGDECVFGRVLMCPYDFPKKVTGEGLFDKNAEDVCWKRQGVDEEVVKDCTQMDGKKIYPVLDGVAVAGAQALCCQKDKEAESKSDYKCETTNTGTVIIPLSSVEGRVGGFFEDYTDGQKFGTVCNNGTTPDNEGGVCKIVNYFNVSMGGTCKTKYGDIPHPNGGSVKVERGVCMPDDTNYQLKVCLGILTPQLRQPNSFYADTDACRAVMSQTTPCIPYLLSSSIPCKGEAGGGGGSGAQSNASGVIKPEIENAVETVVNASSLRTYLSDQQISFNDSQFFTPNTALAAEKIDACTFVQAIIAKESNGDASAHPESDEGYDCGLMQIHINSGNCKDAGLLDPVTNIQRGVSLLETIFQSPSCGDNTSCEAAKDKDKGVGREKFYRYILAGYNGNADANKKSGGDDGICRSDEVDEQGKPKCCSDPCKDYGDACFIKTSDENIFPTQVECPNDRGEFEGTYNYVFKIEDLYKELKNKSGTAGVASCP